MCKLCVIEKDIIFTTEPRWKFSFYKKCLWATFLINLTKVNYDFPCISQAVMMLCCCLVVVFFPYGRIVCICLLVSLSDLFYIISFAWLPNHNRQRAIAMIRWFRRTCINQSNKSIGIYTIYKTLSPTPRSMKGISLKIAPLWRPGKQDHSIAYFMT